jgi:ATP-dependent RNA/DNA helicase IGHMBP2
LSLNIFIPQKNIGTGKTACAGAIAFGFAYQCRSLTLNAKVLACAFSNVGADNLAAEMVRLGLRVVRIGKASAVSKSLWEFTLDAAIDRDPDARKALQDAAVATSSLSQGRGGKEDREVAAMRREVATQSVKASIEACQIAATKALRDADVIVCTSIGAADPRLLAACGIATEEDTEDNQRRAKSAAVQSGDRIPLAPDGLPSLTLPFTIVDEACQSVEPANLIPITSTDSCRSLVLVGDPAQLPPTVKSDVTGNGPLSTSLMERLASILPPPIVTSPLDKTECDDIFLHAKPARQAVSLIEYRSRKQSPNKITYKKQFPGSILLHKQYRMHPSICAFPSAVFYDSLLSTPSYLGRSLPFPDALNSILPADDVSVGVRFVNVGGQRNEHRGEASPAVEVPVAISAEASTSFSNKAEAEHVVHILKSLIGGCKNAASVPGSIGIITPYSAQVSLINTMLDDPELVDLLKFAPTTIEVKSVDAYQGRERDIIIFSAVRSNRIGQIGFLSDWRRMNVAMTRAKSGLIVIGDKETLKGGDVHWEAFIKWCESSCVMTELTMQ